MIGKQIIKGIFTD